MKTKKIRIVFDITDKKLIKDIRKYISGLDGDEMFPFPDSKGGKKQQLSNYLSYLSKREIGVNISTTLLAKIMLSHKYLDNKQAQEKDSKERGHSLATDNEVYVKALP